VTDAATRLASRLERLDNHLAIVLSVHLFVEHLLDRLIDEKSEIAPRILNDHRTYTFSVKLSLVFHMGLLERRLYDNLAALNTLRNTYAHEIDVDLSESFDRGFRTPGWPAAVFRSRGDAWVQPRRPHRRCGDPTADPGCPVRMAPRRGEAARRRGVAGTSQR